MRQSSWLILLHVMYYALFIKQFIIYGIANQSPTKENDMEEHNCPRCTEPMDEGRVSFSGSPPGYVSNRQTVMVRRAATIKAARACPNCGYLELYIDPNELKKNIA